ncbi:MAG: hypothetical protein II046_01115 [Clostridiales bacterium]|nr:hypothetical protein [Clostridiales bacterium]
MENELASAPKKPAKTTRLSAGAKVGIAAAAVTLSMGTLMAIPATRTAISASVRAFFHMEIPEGAEDGQTKELEDRENRVIPTDEVEESVKEEIVAAVSSQDQAADDYYKNVDVTADYYTDAELNKYANYYAQKGYNLLDIKKDSEYDDFLGQFNTNDWYSEGFFVTYWIGDNATGYSGQVICFKATPNQLTGFLKNTYNYISYERKEHNQDAVAYDDFWTKTTDSDGNDVYKASWLGPEPEMKIEPSDRARFANYTLTYDAVNQVVVCTVEAGGGIG